MGDVNYTRAARASCAGCRPTRWRSRGAIDYTERRPHAGRRRAGAGQHHGESEHPAGAGRDGAVAVRVRAAARLVLQLRELLQPARHVPRPRPPNLGATTPMLETRPPIHVKFNGWGGSVNVDWKLAERFSVKSITAYREYDSFFANDNDLSPLASSLGFGDHDVPFVQPGAAAQRRGVRRTTVSNTRSAPSTWTRRRSTRPRRTCAIRHEAHAVPGRRSGQRGYHGVLRPPVVPHHRPADHEPRACATPTSTRTTPSAAAPTRAPCIRRSARWTA